MAEKNLNVRRGNDFFYSIYFENDFSNLSHALKEEGLADKNICVVSDSNVAPRYLNEVMKELSEISSYVTSFVFEAGEKNKNLNTVQQVYEHLIKHNFDRKSFLVALGGGVVGDLTGFTAATYLRGIDFVQIPTTLLAQVDSSVGGKTGVDFNQYKNMVGAFHQPRLVYMNMRTITTLPKVEFACGMGEVIKTGLICDKAFFDNTCINYEKLHALDFDILSATIRRCCEIKAGVVERDPKEQGERALLNLGHTIGHAIEKLMNFQMHHGQCVGTGLVAAAIISRKRGLLTDDEFRKICHACELFELPLKVCGLSSEDIIQATKKDKKMENGQIKFILMDGLGKSYIDKTVTDDELSRAIAEITE